MGPEPIAKNLPTAICQPAYCEAMQASTGKSLLTTTDGQAMPATSPGTTETSACPARQTRASANPACNPPGVLMPQSISLAPAVVVWVCTRNVAALEAA